MRPTRENNKNMNKKKILVNQNAFFFVEELMDALRIVYEESMNFEFKTKTWLPATHDFDFYSTCFPHGVDRGSCPDEIEYAKWLSYEFEFDKEFDKEYGMYLKKFTPYENNSWGFNDRASVLKTGLMNVLNGKTNSIVGTHNRPWTDYFERRAEKKLRKFDQVIAHREETEPLCKIGTMKLGNNETGLVYEALLELGLLKIYNI